MRFVRFLTSHWAKTITWIYSPIHCAILVSLILISRLLKILLNPEKIKNWIKICHSLSMIKMNKLKEKRSKNWRKRKLCWVLLFPTLIHLLIAIFSGLCYLHTLWNNCKNYIIMVLYINQNFLTCSCMPTFETTPRWKCNVLWNSHYKLFARLYTTYNFISIGILKLMKDKSS